MFSSCLSLGLLFNHSLILNLKGGSGFFSSNDEETNMGDLSTRALELAGVNGTHQFDLRTILGHQTPQSGTAEEAGNCCYFRYQII